MSDQIASFTVNMEITEEASDSLYIIQSYSPEDKIIKINQKILTADILISPTVLFCPWDHQKDPLSLASLESFPQNTEIILIGTGKNTSLMDYLLVSSENLAYFYQKNIGVDIMTTQAACRTFNLLASEKRNVVAALIL